MIDNATAVQGLFVGYFGRAANPTGLDFWLNGLESGQFTETEIANSMATAASGEAQGLYPFLGSDDPTQEDINDFVISVYDNLFNRTVTTDDSGVQFWADALESGAATPGGFIWEVMKAAELRDAEGTAVNNDWEQLSAKIQVADAFTEAFEASGAEWDAENDRALTKDIIAATTADNIAEQTTAIEDVVPEGPSVPGDDFTLTESIDFVEGTDGDDTIIGTFEDGSSTITPADTIDGGGGIDRFNVVASDETDEDNFASIEVTNVENFFFRNADSSDLDLDLNVVDGGEQLWIDRSLDDVYLENVGFEFTVGFNKFGYGDSSDEDFDITVNNDIYAGDDDTLNVVLQSAGSINDDDYADLYLENSDGDDVIENMTIQSASAQSNDGNYFRWNDDSETTNYTITGEADLLLELSNASVVETVDASGMAGALEFEDALDNADGVTFTGGSGGSTVEFGGGDDTITGGSGDDLFILGGGEDTVDTGAGDDEVDLDTNTLIADASVNLGAGDDVIFGGTVDQDATVDGGDGTDTLQLQMVASANVDAFTNFEIYDVAGLNKTLDMNILEANNVVEEVVGSDSLGGASELTNLSTDADFRATGDMGGTALTLTQETAGDLTVALDVDEEKADDATNDATTTVVASNATSVSVVFDSDNVDEIDPDAPLLNEQTIDLTTEAATSISVESGGTESSNVLELTDNSDDGDGNSVLESISVTGDQTLDMTYISITNTNVLDTIDAGSMTGDLTVDLDDLANEGEVILGSGDDAINVAVNAGAADGDIETVTNFELSSFDADDELEEADTIDFANDLTVTRDDSTEDAEVADGVVSFLGDGPSTLDEAIGFVDALVTADDEVAAFEYTGDTYAFIENADGDSVVKLAGVTDVGEVTIDSGNAFLV